MPIAKAYSRSTSPRNEFRIIGGRWRHRRCHFPAREGLRPTPDRVRETLFNWLQPRIAGARCLDLFAGSGALGLEALSRGAGEAIFVERDMAAAKGIDANLAMLGEQAPIMSTDALRYLAGPPRPFDLVFLDPPYESGLLAEAVRQLAPPWLHPDARIYLEYPAAAGAPPLPDGWRLLKQSHAGAVGFALAAVDQVF